MFDTSRIREALNPYWSCELWLRRVALWGGAVAVAALVFAKASDAAFGLFQRIIHHSVWWAVLVPGVDPLSVVLLGMCAYLTGVTQALTSAVISLELTDNSNMMLPILATVLLARAASALVCRKPVYKALADRLLAAMPIDHLHTPAAPQAAAHADHDVPQAMSVPAAGAGANPSAPEPTEDSAVPRPDDTTPPAAAPPKP